MNFTYTTLKAALVAMVEDTGTEYAAYLDTLIPLAEDKVLRDLDLTLFDTVATGNFTSGNPLLAKPTGFLALRSLHYVNASTNMVELLPRSWSFLKDYWPNNATTTATPKYFAEFLNAGTPAWHIAGTPASALAYSVEYVKRPEGLDADTATTWLSTNVGDLLLYAALMCSEEYLKADARIATWQNDYVTRLGGARLELKDSLRTRYSQG